MIRAIADKLRARAIRWIVELLEEVREADAKKRDASARAGGGAPLSSTAAAAADQQKQAQGVARGRAAVENDDPPPVEEPHATVIVYGLDEDLVELEDGAPCAACGDPAVMLRDVVLRGRTAIAPACNDCSRRGYFASLVEDRIDDAGVDVVGDVVGDWPSLPSRRP